MPLIPHRLHVYQKPAIGDTFQKAYTTLNYSHKISANGWFDSARCSLAVDRNEAENIFRNYLGNRVAIYVDNPVEPIWEGFINRVNLNTGSVQLSASLDKMTNRVLVQWSTGQGRAPAQTAEQTDADSIATYGSKMVHIDLGELYTTNTGLPTAVRDAIIAQRPTPPVSAIGTGGQSTGLVEIEMLGFYHTLKWDTFDVVTADATDIPRKLLTDTSPSYTYNSGVFYDDTNTSRVDATTSFTAPGTRRAGESTWDMAVKMVEASPSGSRYVTGISPTSPNTGERIAYFEAARETVDYAVDAYGDGRLTNLGGLPVNPWDVRPNRSVLLRNILLGEAETFATGKIAWIKAINYDAESQTVSWETDDDTSLPGVFALNTQEKATNVPLSADRRQIVTDDYDVDSIITDLLTMRGDILADTNNAYDIGSGAARFAVGYFNEISATLIRSNARSDSVTAGANQNLFTASSSAAYIVVSFTDSGSTAYVISLVHVTSGGTVSVRNISNSLHTHNTSGTTVRVNNGVGSTLTINSAWLRMF